MTSLATVTTVVNFNVFESIELYLAEAYNRTGSEQTLRSYKGDIKSFFDWKIGNVGTFGELETLTRYELVLDKNSIRNYKRHLQNELENGNKTINRKIGTIKALYEELLRVDLVESESLESFNGMKSLPTQKNKYGVVKEQELLDFVEYISNKKSKGRQRKLTKGNIMLFAAQTGLRLESILKLKMNDFVETEEGYDVYAEDMKGGKDGKKSLSKQFYAKLMDMYEAEGEGKEYLFNISEKAINEMMKELRKVFNISEQRKIVFHSIRKLAASHMYKMSGKDITVVRDFLDHSSVTITEDYLEDNKSSDMGFVTTMEKNDTDLFMAASLEELQDVIAGLDYATKMLINKKLAE